mgnify:CR=1 FL=1
MSPAPSHQANEIPVTKLALRVGQDIGVSQPRSFSLEELVVYGRMVGDTHWMHTDPERCARESPFGKPVVHWHRLLAAVTELSNEAFQVTGSTSEIFYGIDRARNPAPLLVDEECTATVHLVAVEEVSPNVHHASLRMTFNKKGEAKPVGVVEYAKRWIVD